MERDSAMTTPLSALLQQWRERAVAERADDWCNTEDKPIWKAIHEHRGEIFDKCADELAAALAVSEGPQEKIVELKVYASYVIGGWSCVVKTKAELFEAIARGRELSPVGEVLVCDPSLEPSSDDRAEAAEARLGVLAQQIEALSTLDIEGVYVEKADVLALLRTPETP